jgi:hypothetical protein
MSRWRAFAIHLLISVLIAGSVAAVLFLVWYPPKLLGFAGAEGLLFLMAGIDIVVGPLLTLIVFKAGKKGLKFDLALISLAQAAFLAYGVWTSWQSRPVFIVSVNGTLEVVFANNVLPDELAKAKDPHYSSLPWGRARLVGTTLPEEQEFDAVVKAMTGRDIAMRQELYAPYESSKQQLLDKAETYEAVIEVEPKLADILEQYQADWPTAKIVKVYSKRGMAYMLIDAETAEPIRAVW